MVATTLFVAAGAMAQNQDCAFFFPNQEGEQITRNCYTADGKLTNILVYRVDQAYDYPSGMEVVANYTFTDASGKTLNSGQMVARCNDGNFSMSMGDVATFPTALNMMNADVYMMGDLMNYPNAFSDPRVRETMMSLMTALCVFIKKAIKITAPKFLSSTGNLLLPKR